MSSTYCSLHYHIVFSTKHRNPSIGPAVIADLHAYIGGTIRGLGGVAEAVGGVADHVHILASLPATVAVSDVVREVKKAANAWMREKANVRDFAWQEGYAAFTVSATNREAVCRYIARQEEHHKSVAAADELREFLERAAVAYDPRFFE